MYRRILVAFDGSPIAEHALHEALTLAKDSQASVRVVYAVDVLFSGLGEAYVDIEAFRRDCLQAGRKILDQAADLARQAGVDVETALLEVEGSRFSNAIVAEARRWPAELIVVGSHGRGGLLHLLMGSVAERVVRHAPVPVLLVRGVDAPA